MGKSTAIKTVTSPLEIMERCREIKNRFFPKGEQSAFVILDLETTGLNAQEDWPIEVAALFVTSFNGDYQTTHSFHSYLDWLGHGMANPVVFNERLEKTNAAMRERDPGVHRMDATTLQAIGKNPQQVMVDLGALMRNFFSQMGSTCRVAICGHNVFAFDANFLHHTFARMGIQSPVIPSMLDTGLIVKAAQVHDDRIAYNEHTELLDWIREVKNLRASVKWALEKFCGPTFNLKARMPKHVLDMPHSALTDAWSVLTLMQMFDS
jgi:DNA polymerase III epsilon subunit-like protein